MTCFFGFYICLLYNCDIDIRGNPLLTQIMKMTNNYAAQVRDLAGKVALLEEEKDKNAANTEKLLRVLSEKTTVAEEKTKALEEKEKEWADRGERLVQAEKELALQRSREIDQGAFAALVVEKLLQTADFGELAAKMSVAATSVGKQEVLNMLMAECPQLKLKKERFGWDPYAIARANKLQQEVLKGKHKFRFLEEIPKRVKEQGTPLTLEQVRSLSTNYDTDLDATVEEIPETYPFEDEGVPVLCLESIASTHPPTTTDPAIETEQAGL